MTDLIVTKKGIRLIPSDVLIDMMKTIEKNGAGWWWSIAQRPGYVTVTLGPGRNSPRPDDVLFSKTTVGDSGFDYDHPTVEATIPLLVSWIERMFVRMNVYREDIVRHQDISKVPRGDPYRFQTDEFFTSLRREYERFISKIIGFEQIGYVFDNIHLGACDTTVDCSLRGTDPYGIEFDYTHDYYDNISISESLVACIEDLEKDITLKSINV